ncbi:MAG TPA: DNA polymerase IV, partial [Streptosporangiaceae bacterium]
ATRLDCTVGIGENKLQAKLATGFGKPAGVFRLTSGNWYEVLGDRHPDALWGVGARTAQKLAGLGLHTVRGLAAADPDELARAFGAATGPWLVLLARGRGSKTVDDTPYRARSHGREVTYQEDITDWAEVTAEVARLAGTVAAELSGAGAAQAGTQAGVDGPRPAARVVVKVRYAPFITQTHGQALPEPTVDAGPIRAAALAALERFPAGRPVRMLGVRAEFAP